MTISLAENKGTGEAAMTEPKFPELSGDFYLHFEGPERFNHPGKQKLVYRAIWKPIQRKVIVKYHIKPERTELTEMEMVAHPLSLSHPNVVETHVVGRVPEVFLVEREVTALHNNWPLSGLDEAVTLLCHITRALSFLERKEYIHADIKPENLGLDRDRFILMDFGSCKKLIKFDRQVDRAGTVRTRAPEVLAKSSVRNHKSDLWSLAASLFRLYTHRFPLILDSEEAQLDKKGLSLKKVINSIEERAKGGESWRRDFWEHKCWEKVPLRLQPLMKLTLERDPVKRIDAITECLDRLRRPVTESDRKPGNVPYYGANGQQGWIDRALFDEPLILVAEDGGYFDAPERGVAYRINGPAWVNNHAHILRAVTSHVDTEFLHRALRHFNFLPFISGTTRAKLNQGQLNAVKLAVPPLDLQRAFVTRVEHLRRVVDLAARAAGQLDALFSALQHRAFRGDLARDADSTTPA